MNATTLENENAMELDTSALLVHTDFLRRIALGLLGDESLADDAVQETWIRAMKSGPANRSKIRGWLASVTRNEARQILRSESRRAAREETTSRREGLPSTSEIAERERVRREIITTVMELPEHYRDVLLMRYYDDLPPREIARRLDVSVDTVQTRLRRGTEAMRSRLDRTHESREAWRQAILPLAFPAGLRSASVATSASAMALGSKGIAIGISALVLIAALITWFAWPDADRSDNVTSARVAATSRSDAASNANPADSNESAATSNRSSNTASSDVNTGSETADRAFADRANEAGTTADLGRQLADPAPPGVVGRLVNPNGEALEAHPIQLHGFLGDKLADVARLMIATPATVDENIEKFRRLEATSDAEGRFRFGPIEPGTYVLSALAVDGHPVQTLAMFLVGITDLPPDITEKAAEGFVDPASGMSVHVLTASDVIELDFEREFGRKLRGRIVDEDGQPIADARVYSSTAQLLSEPAVLDRPDLTPMSLTTTDSQGEFEIDGALGATGIGVLAGGFVPSVQSVDVEAPTPDDAIMRLEDHVLTASVEWDLQGIVVDEDGPVAGASIARSNVVGAQAQPTVSGEQGSFRMSFSQAEGSATTLRVTANGYASADLDLPQPDAPECGNLRIELERMSELTVRVRDERGEPIADAWMWLDFGRRTGGRRQGLPTNESGITRFPEPRAAKVTLATGLTGYESASLELDLTHGAPREIVDVILRPVSWQIAVKLQTPAGDAAPEKLQWPGLPRGQKYFSLRAIAEDPTGLLQARGKPLAFPGRTWSSSGTELTEAQDGQRILRIAESWKGGSQGWLVLYLAGHDPIVQRFDRTTREIVFTIDPDAVRRNAAVIGAIPKTADTAAKFLSKSSIFDPDGNRLTKQGSIDPMSIGFSMGADYFLVDRPGLYSAHVVHQDLSGRVEFPVTLGRANIVEVTLGDAKTVSGQAVATSAGPQSGVRDESPVVQLLDDQRRQIGTSRARGGTFKFSGVLPGDYVLRVRKKDHGMINVPVKVTPETSSENLRIEIPKAPILELHLDAKVLGGDRIAQGYWQLLDARGGAPVHEDQFIFVSPLPLYKGTLAPGSYRVILVTNSTGRVEARLDVTKKTTGRIKLEFR